MPSLSSLLFNKNQEHSCCSCGCHLNEQETSTILSPTRWFPRIRRRSSSSSSTASSNASLTMSLLYEEEYNSLQGNKQIDQFQEAYQLAVDEVLYTFYTRIIGLLY
jgi:hypothetical protein